jgi:hypothetical protein
MTEVSTSNQKGCIIDTSMISNLISYFCLFRNYVPGPAKDDYAYRNAPIRVPTPIAAELVAPAIGGGVSSNRPMQQGAVMMVYGLCADKMNPDRVFNIFCLYGNVVRIKFLKSKQNACMVQVCRCRSPVLSLLLSKCLHFHCSQNNTYLF